MNKPNAGTGLARKLVYIIPALCIIGTGFLAFYFGFSAFAVGTNDGVSALIFMILFAIIAALATYALFRMCRAGLTTGKLPWQLPRGVWYWGLLSAVISLLGFFLLFLFTVMVVTHQYI
jgi:hypothetical protein